MMPIGLQSALRANDGAERARSVSPRPRWEISADEMRPQPSAPARHWRDAPGLATIGQCETDGNRSCR